jgi:hypothetical protein
MESSVADLDPLESEQPYWSDPVLDLDDGDQIQFLILGYENLLVW